MAFPKTVEEVSLSIVTVPGLLKSCDQDCQLFLYINNTTGDRTQVVLEAGRGQSLRGLIETTFPLLLHCTIPYSIFSISGKNLFCYSSLNQKFSYFAVHKVI